MAKNVVIGKHGQLATAFAKVLSSSSTSVFLEKEEIGLWQNANELKEDRKKLFSSLMKAQPQVVINTAAYTAVDKAETDREFCYQLNVELPKALAEYASANKAKLIHYSTDYVYSGASKDPQLETNATGPMNYYGETKLLGEDGILDIAKSSGLEYLIFRTSWVFSPFGSNFVKTILRLAGDREELQIVNDQFGAPTSAFDLARYSCEILNRPELGAWKSGIYHLTNSGEASWYTFAEKIIELAKERRMPLKAKSIKAITSEDFLTSAKRPRNSRLSLEKIKRDFGLEPRNWTEALKEVIDFGTNKS